MSKISKLKEFIRLSSENRSETGRAYLSILNDLFNITRHRLTPAEYYRLSLYKGIPANYLSIREYGKIEKQLNSRQTGVISFDKWHQYCFFRGLNFPTPEVFGFISGQRGIINGKPYAGDIEIIFDLLDLNKPPIVTKPFDGGHGDGFNIIIDWCREKQTMKLKNGGTVYIKNFLEQIAKDPAGLLFQQHVEQHPVLATLHPNSLNTFRILTVRFPDGTVKIASTVLKIGCQNSIIDNMGAGGIAAQLNTEKGTIGPGFKYESKELYRIHPETKAQIEGIAIPFWRESLKLASDAHQHLTKANALGWDVAVTESGPLLIEVNSHVPIPMYQKLGHSVYEIFTDAAAKSRDIQRE